jgi:hypothetical protein
MTNGAGIIYSLPVHQDERRYGYIRNSCLTEADISVHVILCIPPNRINKNNMRGLARDHLVDRHGMGNPQGISQLAQSWCCRCCRPCVVRRDVHAESQGQIRNAGAYLDWLGGCMQMGLQARIRNPLCLRLHSTPTPIHARPGFRRRRPARSRSILSTLSRRRPADALRPLKRLSRSNRLEEIPNNASSVSRDKEVVLVYIPDLRRGICKASLTVNSQQLAMLRPKHFIPASKGCDLEFRGPDLALSIAPRIENGYPKILEIFHVSRSKREPMFHCCSCDQSISHTDLPSTKSLFSRDRPPTFGDLFSYGQ